MTKHKVGIERRRVQGSSLRNDKSGIPMMKADCNASCSHEVSVSGVPALLRKVKACTLPANLQQYLEKEFKP